MAKFKRVKEGDVIAAEDYNAIAEALERFDNLSVSGHLRMWSGPDGKHLALHVPVETLALLSGATSPYSFVEVDEDAAGAFVTRGVGDSCSNCVYEVNGVAGLGGTVVPITWTEAGDWRFQYLGNVNDSTCSGPTQICLTVTSDGCGTPGPVYGATVTVKDHTGAVVGSCTTTGMVTALTLVAGGSGYTNGTGYAIGFSGGGGGTGASGTFDVVGGAVTNLVLTNGGSGYTTTVTVSFPGAGGGSGAVASATVRGRCCVSVPATDIYTVVLSVPGAADVTGTVAVPCNTTTNFTLAVPTNAIGTACFTFTHCGYGNGGDVITITGTGTAGGMTDANGQACFRLGVGSYNYSLLTPNGRTRSGTFNVFACTTSNINVGFAVVQFCHASSLAAAGPGCSVSVSVQDPSTHAVLGSGTETITCSGGICSGQLCMTLASEVLNTDFAQFEVVVVRPSGTTTSFAPMSCYPPGGPYLEIAGC